MFGGMRSEGTTFIKAKNQGIILSLCKYLKLPVRIKDKKIR